MVGFNNKLRKNHWPGKQDFIKDNTDCIKKKGKRLKIKREFERHIGQNEIISHLCNWNLIRRGKKERERHTERTEWK